MLASAEAGAPPALDGVDRLLNDRRIDSLDRNDSDYGFQALGGFIQVLHQFFDILVDGFGGRQDQLVGLLHHADGEHDCARIAVAVNVPVLAAAAPAEAEAATETEAAAATRIVVHVLAVNVPDHVCYGVGIGILQLDSKALNE